MTSRLSVETSPALPRGLLIERLDDLYVEPVGLLSGDAAAAAVGGGRGWTLAGSPLAFALVDILLRESDRVRQCVAGFAEVLEWSAAEGEAVANHVGTQLARLTKARPAFAGLALDRPRVMGIVNVTPDSFSDGGRFANADAAIAHGQALLQAGAEIIDVGGESTRPGSSPVDPQEEIRRVSPVIRALAERGAVVSVDTRHAAVMTAAVEAGAAIINDITALTGDAGALAAAAASGASVILMHMQGEPASMQQDPAYDYAPLDVYDALAERLQACRAAGIPDHRLCIDPGIGFGKTDQHNLQVLAHLGLYHGLGVPILLGVSRKGFISRISRGESADRRLGGSLAAALAGVQQGVQIVRVHDVAETVQALTIWRAGHLVG